MLIKNAVVFQRAGQDGSVPELRILDLCTGSGCIALLLHSMLAPQFPNLTITGADISGTALTMARKNLAHNISEGNLQPRAAQDVDFIHKDIRESPRPHDATRFDVVISNPPYIEENLFMKTTSKSVRHFEPKLALVPFAKGNKDPGFDIYAPISRLACGYGAKILLFEIGCDGNLEACMESMNMKPSNKKGSRISPYYWQRCEVWRDDMVPAAEGSFPVEIIKVEKSERQLQYELKGGGNARAFVTWSGTGGGWLGHHE